MSNEFDWKNKPLKLTRYFYDTKEFQGRFGEFYFLTKNVKYKTLKV